MPLTRRELLGGGLTVGLATTLSGCLGESVGASMDGVFETPDPNAMEQELDGGFDRLVWQPDGSAEIYFEADNQMNSFHLLHEYRDNPADEIAACAAPEFSGMVKAPLVRFMKSEDVNYPTRRFKLVGTDVITQGCQQPAYGVPYEVYGTAYFTVPERFDL